MDWLITALVALSGLGLIPACGNAAYTFGQLERCLRERHPDVWAQIAPDPLAEPDVSAPYSRFVTRRAYRTLGDPALTVLGDACFVQYHVVVAVFLVFVLSGLAYAVFVS